jgi:hypothetical protein
VKSAALIGALFVVAALCGLLSYEALSRRPDDTLATRWRQAVTVARSADRTKAELPAIRKRDEATQLFLEIASAGLPSTRSRAAMLAGLLRVRNALADPTRRETLMIDAAMSLRESVRRDPANDDAAYDLELLLAKAQRSGSTIPPTRPHGPSKLKGAPSHGTPGTGY